MKAWVLYGAGDLRLEDRAVPKPGAGEALVRVKAAGVCGSDIPRVFETGARAGSLIPGHEFSGVVEEAPGELSAWAGKRVSAFPLIPCMRCDSCLRGLYETCSSYGYIGSRRDGAFAEYVVVPAWNLVELPEGMTFAAAAMLEPAAVALHATRRLDLAEAKSVAVFGAGPVGLLIALWARLRGAERVFVVGTKPAQGNMAGKLGFSDFCDANAEDAIDLISKLTDDAGADACVDAAGTVRSVSDCIRAARAGGQIVLVGNPRADMRLEKDVYWRILRKQLKIFGSWNAGFRSEEASDWTETPAAAQSGALPLEALITHRFALADLARAMDMMRLRQTYFCKVIIE
ncbi:MAG: galactitol-1-phosphate 5-dehydrogenase [Clostridiales Family XIII bacterium]|jgi:L-iditol 2-dehydrogenase|nr:galactitol-1-phosphate 5-dehydrogenase [Clostridiales Family XIII bacterium]